MAKDYSADVPELETAVLTDRQYAAIGRLVRASAAIEDFVTLFICRMLDLSEGKANLLLGVMPIRARLELAREAAAAYGPEGQEAYENWLNSPVLREILDCRNTVAHGLLLGQTKAGGLVFRTAQKLGADTEAGTKIIGREILIYDVETIEERVRVAEAGVSDLPVGLQLQAWLETRRTQPLAPHPKSPPQKKRTGGISSPPESSSR